MELVFLCILFITAVKTQTVSPTTQALPHLTGCISRELVTFRCQWDVGSFQNLTEPGDLRLFYILEKDSKKNERKWNECPSYSSWRTNECYFNSTKTIIWFSYRIQLRSRSLDIIYDEMSFNVEDIVLPDPPVGLNWTLLSMSSSGFICDVIVSWDPPPSAAENVKIGWMLLVYETQYREKDSDQWISMDNSKITQAYIYGLRSNVEYEVRVRSKMRGYNYGDFSESIFILNPYKESRIPVMAVFVFAVVCIGVLLMLVLVSRQQKLMVIFLPPVPGPKIKGIDPELLEKGKLTEFTSILGTHPSLRPELYSSDQWVEFIEVDIDEVDPVCDSQMSGGFRDDDSGRASCCDPDLSDHDQTDLHHPSASGHDGFHPLSHARSGTPHPEDTTWPNGVYSQVSDVTQRGEVVLSPEEEEEIANSCYYNKSVMDSGNNKRTELQHWVTPDETGYTSELTASVISTQHCKPSPHAQNQSQSQEPRDAFKELTNQKTETDSSSLSTAFPIPPKLPSPEYTLVNGVDWKNSLILKPNTQTSPQEAEITFPSTGGYWTAELLDNITH